jgi:hypothetical protein
MGATAMTEMVVMAETALAVTEMTGSSILMLLVD